MANSVEEFQEITGDLLSKFQQEIEDTAFRVAEAEEISDDEKAIRYKQLRIDLLAAVFAALMTEHGSVPVLELRYVPAWARCPNLDSQTVAVDVPRSR